MSIIKINYIRDFFSNGHERSVRAIKNISVSFICKGISILISFIIVPITLGYVSKEEYGLWMAISSIIQWFSFFDVGLGNGLRNKLAESLAKEDKTMARIYISSVFAIVISISILLFIIFYIVGNFVSWNSILNTNILSNSSLFNSVMIVFAFFCIGFVTNIVSSILQANQKYALNDILGLISQIFGLISIILLVNTSNGSLFKLCLIYSGKSAVVMLVATFILFKGNLKELRPSLKYIDFEKALPLMKLGLKFFVSQILYLIVTQTSIFLVIQLYGPTEVTIYNLAFRYVSITSIGFMTILTPYLSAFTEAYSKGDLIWIKNTIRNINKVWAVLSIITLIMVFISSFFFQFWVGKDLPIPMSLILVISITSIVTNLTATYSMFLNGIGKISVQLYTLTFQAILYFPLTYFFFKLNFGLISVILPQFLFYLISSFIMKIQYNKIINRKAEGLWNK